MPENPRTDDILRMEEVVKRLLEKGFTELQSLELFLYANGILERLRQSSGQDGTKALFRSLAAKSPTFPQAVSMLADHGVVTPEGIAQQFLFEALILASTLLAQGFLRP